MVKNISTLILLCTVVLFASCRKEEDLAGRIELDKKDLVLVAGEQQTLSVLVPEGYVNTQFVRWTTSDESVVLVSSDGKVTAMKAGSAVVTATAVDPDMTATCHVTVKSDLKDLFATVQSGIYFSCDWGPAVAAVWQYTQGLQHDMYSGYFHDVTPKFNDKNSVYNINTKWSNGAWNYTYEYIAPAVFEIEERTEGVDTLLYLAAINKILKVELLHRITDTYGPILYESLDSVSSQQEAYKAFFRDLDKAVEWLDAYLQGFNKEKDFLKYDMLNCQNLSGWIRFANSLRLRLAMRISNVDRTAAAREARKALINPYGVLEQPEDIIRIFYQGYLNPLYYVTGWGEVYMGATMASVLNGYEDPRREKWFRKATLSGHTNEWLGVPQGVLMHEGDPDHYKRYSVFNAGRGVSVPAILMTAAEVWFLRAEAALRGYSAENMQACYEVGVETSFSQWQVGGAGDYLREDSKVPLPYIERISGSGGKDMPARITISPKWDNSASNEVKLECIITQKWLACFPESYEAWSEQRRTGYPKLFFVQTNNSGGTIDTKAMIRRLPFTDCDMKTPSMYREIMSELGGDDNGGTRLWWDAGGNKF